MHMDVPVPPLVIIPCDPRTPAELDVTARCLVAVWTTARDAPRSSSSGRRVRRRRSPARSTPPRRASSASASSAAGEPASASPPASTPASRRALAAGRDAVLRRRRRRADRAPAGWRSSTVAPHGHRGPPAAVVGGRIRPPERAPRRTRACTSPSSAASVPPLPLRPLRAAGRAVPRLCPVSGAIALIRHEALAQHVGLLDESLAGASSSSTTRLRVFGAGLECVYEPPPSRLAAARLEPRASRTRELVELQALETQILVRDEGPARPPRRPGEVI